MNLVLPEPVRQWVEAEAGRTGRTPEALVLRVLYDRMIDGDDYYDDDDQDESNGRPPTAEEIAAAKKVLAAKIQEGLDSGPAVPWTAQDWIDLRRRVEERLAAERSK